mgnify:CR=1 FL=1
MRRFEISFVDPKARYQAVAVRNVKAHHIGKLVSVKGKCKKKNSKKKINFFVFKIFKIQFKIFKVLLHGRLRSNRNWRLQLIRVTVVEVKYFNPSEDQVLNHFLTVHRKNVPKINLEDG